MKLNFGCGQRFSKGWVNIDFHSEHPEVKRVNLLRRLPFPDAHFDVVYSSHVLEHFTLRTAEAILREAWRILKAGGIIRVVVPDLESTCREYVRILDQIDNNDRARRQYDWIVLELLDQLTRTETSGLSDPFRRRLLAAGDQEMIEYVKARTDTNPWTAGAPRTLAQKLRRLTLNEIKTRLLYLYVAGVKQLLPPSLRKTIVDNTRIGEKHKWMYDRHGLAMLMAQCGFTEVSFLAADRSAIPGFNEEHLDIQPDGTPYKRASLYCEARKR
jgi:SAM-dependent methyltransferase